MTIGEPVQVSEQYAAPSVEVGLFDGHEKARFWIGRTALFNVVEMPEEYLASLRLRGMVYVAKGFLPEYALTPNGLDIDHDDNRSVHFAVAEQAKDGSSARLAGTTRMIAKRDESDLLPIERNYPELFTDNPIQADSMEVSRFISQHEDRFLQHVVALSLIRAMTHYAINNEVPKVYYEIEEPLWKVLKGIGLPMVKLSEPKELVEYGNTMNMAVEIDPIKVIDAVTADKTGTLLLTQFFRDEGPNEGLGFYKTSLVGGGDV